MNSNLPQGHRKHAHSHALPYRRSRRLPAFSLPLSLLVSLALTLPILLLMLLLAALILLRLPDPTPLLTPIALSFTAIGALFGGFLTVRLHQVRGLISGAAFGTLYGITILLSALTLGVTNALLPLLSIPICAPLSAVAGYFGLPKGI